MNDRLAAAIKASAERIGANPADLATVISYETGGTFDPWKKGPTTQWGVHRGLIQMGEPQRQKYGYSREKTIEELVDASANYLVDNGFKPGMGLLDMYSTINAGAPGRYNASDAGNGGAPGTVRDKVEQQMGSHKAKAIALLNGEFTPSDGTDPFAPTEGDIVAPIVTDASAGLSAPTPTNIVDQNAQLAAQPQPYDSFGQEFGASFQSTSITAHALRWASEGTVDPNFTLGEDRAVALAKEFPSTYHDFLLSSGSEVVLQQRLKWASEDVVRQERLAAGGWSATGAGLLSGILDPVVSIPSILTGGAGGAAMKGLSFAGRIAASSAAGAASNAAIDLAAQKVLDDPHADPIMAGASGALFGALGGALMRGKGSAAKEIAEEAFQTAAGFKVPQSVQLPGNAGAARNPLMRDSLIGDQRGLAIEMRDEDVAKGFGGSLLRSVDVTGQMTTAKNPLTRLIGANLFEETAGFADHSVVPDSVNSRFTALHRKMTGNFNLAYSSAKRDFIKEAGLSKLNLTGRAQKEAEFNRAVADFIWDDHPSPDTNPHVVKAAGALQKNLADFAEEMKKADLWGGNADPKYLPLVANHDRIAHLDTIVHQDVMERFIKESIRNHTAEISDELASRMAKGYWANIRKAGYGIEDGMSKSLHLNDREGFKASFHEALDNKNLLSDEELGQVYDLLSGMMDEAKKTPADGAKGIGRLKRRTLMDYNYRAGIQTRDGGTIELRMRDLFEDDAELLYRRYARSMSGRIEFAKTKIMNPSNGEIIADGIRSEADLAKLKSSLAESYRLMPGTKAEKDKELANALENIDYGWKRINGLPIYGSEKGYAQWARRLKTMQFIRLMSNMGLNQVQETWKIVSLTGFKAALSQIPSIRGMARDVASGKIKKDRLLAELEDITGIGLDNLWNRYDLRLDDDRLGAETGGKVTQFVDNVLDAGQRLTSNVSFMHQIHDYQQRWAMKAITQQMAEMARKTRTAAGEFDYGKLKEHDRNRLASIGLGEADAKLLFKNLLDHSEFDGRKIVGVNTAAWDAEAVGKYRVFLGRYTDRLVQANDFGALSKWMSHPVMSMFVQFRSFVFGAWAKSTLWSLNHGAFTDPKMLVLLLGEIAAGSATYAVRQATQATTADDWDTYWDETMRPVNLVKNGWARSASSSILPSFIDTLLMATPIEPQFGQARTSGSATDAWLGSPAVDHANSALKFSRGLINSVRNDDELTQSQIKAGMRLMPLGNWFPLTAALGRLIQDRPNR